MNVKHLVVAAALLATPLVVVATQPALATAVALTGNFSVALSGSGLQNDTLSIENSGTGKSNFTESLSNSSRTMNGSFSEPLTNGSLSYGIAEFFDINISQEDPTLTISFTSLSDGTASTSCTNGCVYMTSFDSNGFPSGTLTASFTDGKSLTIALSDDRGTDIKGNIQLTLNSPTGVPEPASLALLGSALVGFGAIRRRRRKAA